MTPVEKYADLCNRLDWHRDGRPSYRRDLLIRSIQREIDNLIRDNPQFFPKIEKAGVEEANCIACHRESGDEELVAVDNVGLLCQGCYGDGVADHNTHMALYSH